MGWPRPVGDVISWSLNYSSSMLKAGKKSSLIPYHWDPLYQRLDEFGYLKQHESFHMPDTMSNADDLL